MRMAARTTVCFAKLRACGSSCQPRFKGKHHRNPDHKCEGREDQVGRGQAVPFGVIHEVPRAGAAVVVHHDHEADGDAADHIEREQPAERRRRGGCLSQGGRGCRGSHSDSRLRETRFAPTLRAEAMVRQAQRWIPRPGTRQPGVPNSLAPTTGRKLGEDR